MKRRVVIATMFATAMLCMTSCGVDNKEQATQLLEEKYGEKFTVIENYGGGSLLSESYGILATSEECPDVLFEAEVADDGSYIVDEYITARVCRQIEDNILENLGHPSEEDIVVKVTAISKTIDSVDADMTPEEYIEIKENNQFVIDICYFYGNLDRERILADAFYGMPYLNGYTDICGVDKKTINKVHSYFSKSARADYGYEQILDGEYIERIEISYGMTGKMDINLDNTSETR